MERVLGKVLFTFAGGLFLIGLVVGLLKVSNNPEYCGAVLAHDDGCRQPVSLLAMMLASWGLAVTCAFAAWVAIDPPVKEPNAGLRDEDDE
jgi:hypothetical protein